MTIEEMKWISVENRLPESGKYVLAFYKNCLDKNRTIKAQYVVKWTIPDNFTDPEYEITEYHEEKDEYYLKEGWYEVIDNWDEFAFIALDISNKPTHWMPLPEPPE